MEKRERDKVENHERRERDGVERDEKQEKERVDLGRKEREEKKKEVFRGQVVHYPSVMTQRPGESALEWSMRMKVKEITGLDWSDTRKEPDKAKDRANEIERDRERAKKVETERAREREKEKESEIVSMRKLERQGKEEAYLRERIRVSDKEKEGHVLARRSPARSGSPPHLPSGRERPNFRSSPPSKSPSFSVSLTHRHIGNRGVKRSRSPSPATCSSALFLSLLFSLFAS